jgi:hypothetical protein
MGRLICATTWPSTGEARSKNGSPAWMPQRGRRCLLHSREWGRAISRTPKAWARGCLEYRINWGPGYRVYFGRDGEVLVILLTGGTKKRQPRDIERAKALWADYKRRRKPPAR